MCSRSIVHFSLLVRDYDEAIKFYKEKLNFIVLEDTKLSETKRWVRISPSASNSNGAAILLAKADNENQIARIGDQSGGRVFLFLHTDDFWRDYNHMINQNVVFVREPIDQPWGIVAVFQDLYGNLWDLMQPKSS
eukprot:TRINITY_DN4602_c0_g2_i1.p1 TRINITY_DN4602_c0_g2~~TRINITY_DN4602_c0_g2_i1.p1  ORF type:complete len:135 (-),score=55.29 TRINITY_DN4602_c0_g2_i1:137-541(-)